MAEEKFFAVAKGGHASLNKMGLNLEEADALILALQGTLVSEIDGGRKKKITRSACYYCEENSCPKWTFC